MNIWQPRQELQILVTLPFPNLQIHFDYAYASIVFTFIFTQMLIKTVF